MRVYKAPLPFLALLSAFLAAGTIHGATDPQGDPPPVSPVEALAKIEAGLLFTPGPVEVVVCLKDPPLAQLLGRNGRRIGHAISDAQQIEQVRAMIAKQDEVVRALRAKGGKPVMRLTRVLNAVVARIDSSNLVHLARIHSVASIRSGQQYSLDLANTTPYVGATALWSAGVDGTGVRVAVLDTGVDYTHKSLGGDGTASAYEAAFGTSATDARATTRDSLFPTAKVVGGWDYVGETAPTTDLLSDPDPIDSKYNPTVAKGHGTHVADILAGSSNDGTHKGMAPGAKIYAFKVCSSQMAGCFSSAILSGLEAALNPDNPPDPTDIDHPPDNWGWDHWTVNNPVDVVNLSLGEPYGMIQKDLVAAVQALADYGVVVVCSAGNSGDKPYAVGAPAVAPGAIGVAQTQATTARSGWVTYRRTGETETHTVLNTASVSWAPVTRQVSASVVVVGPACTADDVPATVSGKIALIDRNVCSAVSTKVMYAAQKGAIGVVIGMDAPGDPISFSQAPGTSGFVPTLVIGQADALAIKASVAAGKTTVSLVAVPMGGSIVSSSSRGPSASYQSIKPDLGAPGTLVSALVGAGTGEETFGGTSGASPVVAGAAALLLQAFPAEAPYEIKARLMNNAFTSVRNNPQLQPGVLAPVSRIGAGELRVDKAYQAKLMAYDDTTLIPSLSFGYAPLSQADGVQVTTRTVRVKNLRSTRTAYRISQTYAQRPTGAVIVGFQPATLALDPGSSGTFQVRLQVTPSALPGWTLDGGANGGNGELLRQLEFSGFVFVTGGGQSVRLPWHLLPHKSAEVTAAPATVPVGGQIGLSNPQGATVGEVEVFALTGSSPRGVGYACNLVPLPPGLGDMYYYVDLKSVGIRLTQDAGGNPWVEFAIATWDERVHSSYPAQFGILIDADLDGLAEYQLFNAEVNGRGATGQSAVYLYDASDNLDYGPYAYADTDFNSATTVLGIPLARLGLTPSDPIQFVVFAGDNSFEGDSQSTRVWDYVGANGSPPVCPPPAPDADPVLFMRHAPGLPRFAPGAWSAAVPVDGSASISVSAGPTGGDTASPHQTGFLLLYRNAKPGRWSAEIRVTP